MPEIELRGCRTQPLMSYLKALGVLRHVGSADPDARLGWRRAGHAFLRSSFTEEGLTEFFVTDYAPSPITSPWNGASGYHGSHYRTARETLDTIEASEADRLRELCNTIAAARALIERINPREHKDLFLRHWRSIAPDSALDWIDASMALTEDSQSMNPLLGTGGNDGNFDFSVNFMQHLITCLPLTVQDNDARDVSVGRIQHALFDQGDPRLADASTYFFNPGGAPLPNASSDTGSLNSLNPWDFILLLEGALLFGGGVARRLSHAGASFPFTVPAGGDVSHIGRSLGARSDGTARGETWLPLWRRPAGLAAVMRLLKEGRMQDDRNQARSGRTLQRATASMGADRGIEAFERTVFVKRFGDSYIGVPAGRVEVRPSRQVAVLRAADRWLDRVRRIDVPSITAGVARVERLEHEAIHGGSEVMESWLLALADLQLAVGRRPASRDGASGVRPLAGLPAEIIHRIHAHAQGQPEWELARAAALVGRERSGTDRAGREDDEVSLRCLLEPVAPDGPLRYRWHGERGSGRGVSLRQPVATLTALARARALLSSPPDASCAGLAAVLAFLRAETDDHRLVRLAYALSLCRTTGIVGRSVDRRGGVPRLYALARLVVGRQPVIRADADAVDITPDATVVAALAAGNPRHAARTAVRRLHADGVVPFRTLDACSHADPGRAAAALAFPLNAEGREALARAVLWPAAIHAPEPRSGALE